MKRSLVSLILLLAVTNSFAEPPRPIKAAIGDEFAIVLDSNRSTGYGWQLASPIDKNMLLLSKSEYIPGSGKVVGAGGEEEWTFKAVGQGQTTISFKYVKSWEKGVQPAREAALTIIVTDQSNFTGQGYLDLSSQQRLETIQDYILRAKKQGVTIRNSPSFYCNRLDEFYAKHPDYKKESLSLVLKTLIIMEYDWEQSGADKDRLAREWLGEDLYKTNKLRLGKK